ncbi:hypothetical protein CSB37_01155 [bacterium DOLZORAL124_38_8]|nr:MAG: hypothetical protein CSB37_01155 [bacterium DOLZORAL124_38_8]
MTKEFPSADTLQSKEGTDRQTVVSKETEFTQRKVDAEIKQNKFPKHFPRCIACNNEYSQTNDAINHLYELYPWATDAAILKWLTSFKDNKKILPRIQDIITALSKQVHSTHKLNTKRGYNHNSKQYHYGYSGD